jgi:hypothetical protein
MEELLWNKLSCLSRLDKWVICPNLTCNCYEEGASLLHGNWILNLWVAGLRWAGSEYMVSGLLHNFHCNYGHLCVSRALPAWNSQGRTVEFSLNFL